LLHWKMLKLWKTKMHLCFLWLSNKKGCQSLIVRKVTKPKTWKASTMTPTLINFSDNHFFGTYNKTSTHNTFDICSNFSMCNNTSTYNDAPTRGLLTLFQITQTTH
jgi:hypothetical protein